MVRKTKITRAEHYTLIKLAEYAKVSRKFAQTHLRRETFPSKETKAGRVIEEQHAMEFAAQVKAGSLPRFEDDFSTKHIAKLAGITYQILMQKSVWTGKLKAYKDDIQNWRIKRDVGEQFLSQHSTKPCVVIDIKLWEYFSDFKGLLVKAVDCTVIDRKDLARVILSDKNVKHFYVSDGTRLSDGTDPMALQGSYPETKIICKTLYKVSNSMRSDFQLQVHDLLFASPGK